MYKLSSLRWAYHTYVTLLLLSNSGKDESSNFQFCLVYCLKTEGPAIAICEPRISQSLAGFLYCNT